MTEYSSKCTVCQQRIWWVECPAGGWWVHDKHPRDGHNAETFWAPEEHMNDYGEWETI